MSIANKLDEIEEVLEEVNEEAEECEEEEEVSEESKYWYPEPTDNGQIDLYFTENLEHENTTDCYPRSFYTVSAKERLLLTLAENFRRQFVNLYRRRLNLVLAVKNECNVQKFVCTTIRPTKFLIPELICNLEGPTSFVADFIAYEPLENHIALPTRLMSPSRLLRARKGNSYEMATLLCSMLIGAGFSAVVVSGVARRYVILNDQTQFNCPTEVKEDEEDLDDLTVTIESTKYLLRPMPDLDSHLSEKIAVLQKKKDDEEKMRLDKEEQARLNYLDIHTKDRYKFRRYHAWVAIIENAPWSLKGIKTYINEDGKEVNEPMSAFFIEPSTGVRHEVDTNHYLLVETIWNDENYFLNKQVCEIKNIDWDVTNKEKWENFLPAEPVKCRNTGSESEENLEAEDKIWIEKHLDTLRSWVEKLQISDLDFESRFPNFQKAIKYNKCIHVRYTPYSQTDGKVNQITYYSDDDYETPTLRWICYEQRTDFLEKIKVSFITEEIKEFFLRGRKDCLRNYYHTNDTKKPKILNFYHLSRSDSLKQMRIYPDSLCLYFKGAHDLCCYQEFRMKPNGPDLEAIIEKFDRNTSKPADEDIASRHFALTENKIFLTFHYNEGAVTASSREFTKPPKTAYGKEIIFDPSTTKGYIANAELDELTQLQLYVLLLQQLKREEKVKKLCDVRYKEYHNIIDNRKDEMATSKLKFSMFDKLRNRGARNIRIKKFEEEQARKLEVMNNDADFLAPYLVFYTELPPSPEQSLAAYNSCLNDLKDRYIRLLNELQRKYEDLTHERNALNRFLSKFETQFDNFDYERLVQEAKDIQLNQRMVQQRLTTTHEEAQKKFEKVKEFLLKDDRLNLSG